MRPPFFHAKKSDGGVVISGVSSCFLGHEIKHPDRKSDGIFAEWSWERNRLKVRNDRYGFLPLYYFAAKNEIAVSPSIPQLVALGAPTGFDVAALAVCFRLGFFIAEDTPFEAIKALPPDSELEWEDGTLRGLGQLTLSKSQNMDRNEAIDRYISLLRAAVMRRLPGEKEFAVPLTGGRDSRHIMLELCERGYSPKFSVTQRVHAPQPNDDGEIASVLASSLNIEHIILDEPASLFALTLQVHRETSFCAISGFNWILQMADYLSEKVSLIYDGIAGDILSSPPIQVPGYANTELIGRFESGSFDELAELILGREVAELFLEPMEREKFSRQLAKSRLKLELVRHAEAPNPVGSFVFWNRTRRYISLSPNNILNKNLQVFSPYLDYDLYDFLSSLPGSMVEGKTFHTDTIRRAYPQYAHIPYSDAKGRELQNRWTYRKFAFDTLRYSLSHSTSNLVNYVWLMPRLVRCIFDVKYSSSIEWLAPLAIYLLELETLSRERRV